MSAQARYLVRLSPALALPAWIAFVVLGATGPIAALEAVFRRLGLRTGERHNVHVAATREDVPVAHTLDLRPVCAVCFHHVDALVPDAWSDECCSDCAIPPDSAELAARAEEDAYESRMGRREKRLILADRAWDELDSRASGHAGRVAS